MDEYEKTYQKFKQQWDFHYQKVRDFIYNSMNEKIENWGFIGVTNSIPEINSKMLERVEKLSLLDINERSMAKAKEYILKKYNFENIELIKFDNTAGFTDMVIDLFQKHENRVISEDTLFDRLGYLEKPNNQIFGNLEFDFITHLGLMDYYIIPIFNKHCENFKRRYTQFYQVLRKLSDDCVNLSIKILYEALSDNGSLIISTPITRIPEGELCRRSLFWYKPLEEYLEKVGFIILKKSQHRWEEFPIPDGHSHAVLNIHCKRTKK